MDIERQASNLRSVSPLTSAGLAGYRIGSRNCGPGVLPLVSTEHLRGLLTLKRTLSRVVILCRSVCRSPTVCVLEPFGLKPIDAGLRIPVLLAESCGTMSSAGFVCIFVSRRDEGTRGLVTKVAEVRRSLYKGFRTFVELDIAVAHWHMLSPHQS